jgi:hypothetical protein
MRCLSLLFLFILTSCTTANKPVVERVVEVKREVVVDPADKKEIIILKSRLEVLQKNCENLKLVNGNLIKRYNGLVINFQKVVEENNSTKERNEKILKESRNLKARMYKFELERNGGK